MSHNTQHINDAETNKSVSNFAKITESMLNTYELKNSDYGNSFDETCDKFGIIAAIVRMQDKLNRVYTLTSNKSQKVVTESIKDTLLDLANYAIMTTMWYDDHANCNPTPFVDLLNKEDWIYKDDALEEVEQPETNIKRDE